MRSPLQSGRRIPILAAIVLGVIGIADTDRACAGDWMYAPSYHHGQRYRPRPARPVPPLQYRTAYRPAVPGSGFGAAIEGGYRFNRIFLRSGLSTDLTVIREDWFQVRQRP